MTTKPEFVYVTWIQAPIDKVWSALKDAELTKQYWGVHKNVSDWTVGSEWRHVDYDDEQKVAVRGKILEHEPPNRLKFTWKSAHDPSQTDTIVTFSLVEAFGATKVTLMHENLPDAKKGPVVEGWPAILSSLKTLLETGKPMSATSKRWGQPPASAT